MAYTQKKTLSHKGNRIGRPPVGEKKALFLRVDLSLHGLLAERAREKGVTIPRFVLDLLQDECYF